MAPDPFGRAVRDHYLGEQEEPLIDRDGDETREHSIEEWYFGEYQCDEWFESWLDGPLLDMGAGAGRDALYFQEQFETVAIEVSKHLVETMRDRGVDDARLADMFSLQEHFERDRFQSAFALGTQVQLAGSMQGLRQFLAGLSFVTIKDATVVLHGYAPELEITKDIFAYREDPTPGLAYRIFHSEYNGKTGRTLLFRLFSIDRLREATIGTPWEVAEASYGHPESESESNTWLAVLRKA
ncbi:SAM-dependent methyltransferase [Halobacteriales archaeon QS_4_62_28]|nr:MAG: SAM-dependent methyltransferase [Halobacteriales archaeon QS_4_62_28]